MDADDVMNSPAKSRTASAAAARRRGMSSHAAPTAASAAPAPAPPAPKRADGPATAAAKRTTGVSGGAGGRYVSAKVTSRNAALNIAGGVHVDVFLRCRPLNSRELASGATSVVEVCPEKKEITIKADKAPTEPFTFDQVFGPGSTQEDVYSVAVAPVVEQVTRGLSCCIFAYGQTGTGKTFTMLGNLADPAQHGIVARAVSETLSRLHASYADVRVRMTYMELYNENLEDLFAPETDKKALRLVDDPVRGTVCHGLSEVVVTDTEQVMSLLSEAESRCRVSETKMNKMSNRAHRVLTLLASYTRTTGVVHTALTLVDLAGSESVARSGAEGAMAKEAGNINKSLLTLGRVINALACNEPHIPYRDSKLTRLTSEALGGVCKTSFIATITPAATDLSETLSTLRYAKNAMEALNVSQLPRWKQDEIMVEFLTRKSASLELELKEERDRARMEEALALQQYTALNSAKELLEADLARSEAGNRLLQSEKALLQSDVTRLRGQRDRLTAQKKSLKNELSLTRDARDGYLADRMQLQAVMTVVRRTRNKLLSAHQATEVKLSADAKALLAVLENTIVDVEALHTEIERKKGLSLANEGLADEFKDALTDSLEAASCGVGEFVQEQADGLQVLRTQLSTMILGRQQEFSSLKQDLTQVLGSVCDSLLRVSTSQTDTDLSDRARTLALRDAQRLFRDATTLAVNKIAEQVETCLGEVRAGVVGLEGQVHTWSGKLTSRLEEVDRTAVEYSTAVNSELTKLEEYVNSAAAQQTGLVDSHKACLSEHVRTEKAALTAVADRLQEDICSQVERLIAEHTKSAARRLETAVATFTSNATDMAALTKEVSGGVLTRSSGTRERVQSWLAATHSSVQDMGDVNQTSVQGLDYTAASITGTCVSGQASASSACSELVAASDTHLENVKTAIKEVIDARSAAVDGTRVALAQTGAALKADVDRTTTAQDSNAQAFKKAAEGVDEGVVCVREGASEWADSHTQALGEAQHQVVQYVVEHMQRDTRAAIPRKSLAYPTVFPKTQAYRVVLAEEKDDWEREERISTGAVSAGVGVDFGRGATGIASRPVIPPTPSAAAAAADSEEDDVTRMGSPVHQFTFREAASPVASTPGRAPAGAPVAMTSSVADVVPAALAVAPPAAVTSSVAAAPVSAASATVGTVCDSPTSFDEALVAVTAVDGEVPVGTTDASEPLTAPTSSSDAEVAESEAQAGTDFGNELLSADKPSAAPFGTDTRESFPGIEAKEFE